MSKGKQTQLMYFGFLGIALVLCIGFVLNKNKDTGSNLPKVETLYLFPNAPSCDTELGKNCFSTPEDHTIYLASKMEKDLILSRVSITPDMEKEIGAELHQKMDYTFINDDRTKRLKQIFNKLHPHRSRQELNYQVFLIKDEVVNAWTTAGGYIYVTTGIYDFAKSDDEIANVLGHEMGHNECSHTVKYFKRRAGTKAVLDSFGGGSIDPSVFVDVFSIATIAFGQHEELEADRDGFYLAAKAGYDPMKGLDFWKRLAAQENENRFLKLFRSHPYSITRYQCGVNYLKEHQTKK